MPEEPGKCVGRADSARPPRPHALDGCCNDSGSPVRCPWPHGHSSDDDGLSGSRPWYQARLFVADGKQNRSHLLAGLASQALGPGTSWREMFLSLRVAIVSHIFSCRFPQAIGKPGPQLPCRGRPGHSVSSSRPGSWRVCLPSLCLSGPSFLPGVSRPGAQGPAVVTHGAALSNPHVLLLDGFVRGYPDCVPWGQVLGLPCPSSTSTCLGVWAE